MKTLRSTLKGIEPESGTGSRMYSTEFPDGIDIPNQSLWSLDKFLTMVLA
jgi:hypothetical protein